MTDKRTKQEIPLRKFLHEAHFQLLKVFSFKVETKARTSSIVWNCQ